MTWLNAAAYLLSTAATHLRAAEGMQKAAATYPSRTNSLFLVKKTQLIIC